MKTDIHPNYIDATITCSCGNTVETRSTKADIHVEICSNCHPFYTGKQKLMDTGGRLARFQAKLEGAGAEDTAPTKKKKANVRTFTPAVDPKVLAAKAARAEAKALEDAKKRKEAEEAEKAARAEAKAAKEREAAEAPEAPDAPEAVVAEGDPAEEAVAETTGGEEASAVNEESPVAEEAVAETTGGVEASAVDEPSPVAEEAASEAAAGETT